MNVFVDESGHSGANLYDPAQPIYACALIWVDPSVEGDFVGAVDDLHRSRGIQTPELKGGRLIKSNPGRRTLISLGNLCLQHGVEVSLVAQHKPFMAAAVVIEECADHVKNPAFDPEWMSNKEIKETAAQFVLDTVPLAILMKWWRARQGVDLEQFGSAHRELISALGSVDGGRDFANAIGQVDLSKIMESPKMRAVAPVAVFSPNTTTFSLLLQGIEAIAEARDIDGIRIIHDEQHEFEYAYRQCFDISRTASPFELQLPSGDTMTLPIRRIASLGFRNSVSCRPLQVSDGMAAVCRVAAALAVAPHEPVHSILKQFRPLLKGFYAARSGNDFPYAIGPRDWQPWAYAALAGLEPHEYGAA